MATKTQIQGGLKGMLNANRTQAPTAAPTVETTATPQEPVKAQGVMKSERGTTVRICYNLNADLVAKAKAIAAYDRKNINEVYNEALQAYIDSWTPAPQEPPQL